MDLSVRSGDCTVGDGWGLWTSNNTTVGTLVCMPGRDDAFYLAAWTFDDDNIAVVAAAANHQAIYSWWKDHAHVLAR